MKTTSDERLAPTLAQCVAGEDLRMGDYITVLNSTLEFLSFHWDRCESTLPPDEVVRVKHIPGSAGQPLKVIAICLPFVYVRSTNTAVETLDLRMTQVVRLDRACAKKIWQLTKPKIVGALH